MGKKTRNLEIFQNVYCIEQFYKRSAQVRKLNDATFYAPHISTYLLKMSSQPGLKKTFFEFYYNAWEQIFFCRFLKVFSANMYYGRNINL